MVAKGFVKFCGLLFSLLKKISLVFDVAHTTSCFSGEQGGLGKYMFVCVYFQNE